MTVISHHGRCSPPANPAVTFPYQTDHFQNHSFKAIENGDHLLVTAHTGSGKTTVAEYAVGYGIKTGKRVIYTAPIKALSNQIFGDFTKKYPHWNIGIKTGDIDYRSEESQVLIMTTEILLNLLYRDRELADVSVVIFDEVHYIKDIDRGHVWERSIMMMPKHIQMIMLSATLSDAEQFCQWIASVSNKDRNVSHTTTTQRAVPLTHYIMTPTSKVMIMDSNGNFDTRAYTKAIADISVNPVNPVNPSKLESYIERMDLPAIFFCFNKNHCSKYAKQVRLVLLDEDERFEIRKRIKNLLYKFPNRAEIEEISQTSEVLALAQNGICYHHAGLLPPLKEIVQELFSQGLIKLLFVTETFAAGVNMPAKTVVFTGLTKYSNNGFRPLYPEEYGQMSGRAGRRGMDTIGTVIHLPFDMRYHPDQSEVKHMMCGKIRNISSTAKADYHYILNCIRYSLDPLDIAKGSIRDRDNKSELAYYQEQIQPLQDKILDLEESLKNLLDSHDSQYHQSFQKHCDYLNGKLKGKQYHKSGTAGWYKENSDSCDKIIALQAELSEVKANLEKTISCYNYLQDELQNENSNVISFLCEAGYVDGNRLTVKGVVASGINEVHPLLLTEILTSGLLDSMDNYSLVRLLAIFLPSKETTGQYPEIIKLVENIASMEAEYGIFTDIEDVYTGYCDMAYYWAQTGKVSAAYQGAESEVQVGEFVKMMVKLSNICREVKSACLVLQKDNLATKLDECYKMIMRGIVVPQSLHVIKS